MRRWFLPVPLAVGASLLTVVSAFANLCWCDDPAVTIVTPAGAQVTVNVWDYVYSANDVPQLQGAVISWTVSEGKGGAQVAMTDTVPCGGNRSFPTHVDVLYNGSVVAAASGVCGRAMKLGFTLPVN